MKVASNHGKLWKNQRIIDEHGLVVCEERERLFQNMECAYLLEDMLMVYQQNKLPLHFMRYIMSSEHQSETITYRGYVGYRCTQKERVQGKNRAIGSLNIIYTIKRLDPQSINCQHPFLLLFDIKCQEVKCQQCQQSHISRITESSFYVIEAMFMQQLKKKIVFMQKYPNYTFTPHSFISQSNAGEAVYEHIKDHNYEPSYYIQRCELVLVNALKMEMMKRGIDGEVARFSEAGEFLQGKTLNTLIKRSPLYKLKYMCRKCQPRQIWTTKDKVPIEVYIVSLNELLPDIIQKYGKNGKKQTIQGSHLQEKYMAKVVEQKDRLQKREMFELSGIPKQQEEQAEQEEKGYLHQMYKTEERRLDRSIRKEVSQYDTFEQQIQPYGTWHTELEAYKHPYIVLVKLTVPKMNCIRCQKQKDGLIYITNLIDSAHSYLNQLVISKLQNLQVKKYKGKNKENKMMN